MDAWARHEACWQSRLSLRCCWADAPAPNCPRALTGPSRSSSCSKSFSTIGRGPCAATRSWRELLRSRLFLRQSSGSLPPASASTPCFSSLRQWSVRKSLLDIHCAVRFPHPSTLERALTTEERGVLYDYAANVVVPCLRSAGRITPQLPSREEFIERSLGQNWDPGLYPRSGRGYPTKDRFLASILTTRCPPLPPGWDER